MLRYILLLLIIMTIHCKSIRHNIHRPRALCRCQVATRLQVQSGTSLIRTPEIGTPNIIGTFHVVPRVSVIERGSTV